MSFDRTATQDAIQSWIDSILSTSDDGFIWASANADHPPYPYYDGIINPVTFVGGSDYHESPDEITGIAEIVGNREFTLQLRSFGAGTIDGLQQLRDSLEKTSVLETLRASGLVFVQSLAGVADITELVNTEMQERGILDLQFRFASVETDVEGVIENLESTMAYKVDNVTISGPTTITI